MAETPAPPTTGATSDRPEDRGSLTIADKVVEKVATAAAREIGQVTEQTTRWRRVTGRALPKATAEIAGGVSRIGVQIAVGWPIALAEVATQTRDHVKERVETLTGMSVTAVDVTIAEVAHLETERRRVQ